MANIRTLKLNLLADVSNFNKELEGVQGKLKGFQNSLSKAGQVSTIALGGLAAAGYTAVKAAEEVAIANGRLDNILTSMGYPEATKRVQDYAQALEVTTAVDAEVIKLTQAKLATFANLTATVDTAGGAFDRATVAALDMAAAGFGSAESNAVQLGKALEDPIKGINALTRSGITFTEAEKEKIKVMVESGDTLGAQNMILAAIEKQVGGTAEATATGSQKMALALGNVSEAIGGALLPFFTQFSEKVIEFTPFLEQNAEMFLKVGAAIAVVAVAVKTLQIGIAALSLVMQIATGITAAFNFVLALNPIGLIVLAVAALAAAFVLAYQKIEPFRDLIDSIYQAIKNVGNAIAASKFAGLIGNILGSFGGGRAAGGSVMAGQSVRVGEFGSEIFTPNSSGVIRKDNGGGGNTFIFNGVIDGESARRSIEQLLQNSARRTGAVNFVGATL
jgi:phage-related minor tail protein